MFLHIQLTSDCEKQDMLLIVRQSSVILRSDMFPREEETDLAISNDVLIQIVFVLESSIHILLDNHMFNRSRVFLKFCKKLRHIQKLFLFLQKEHLHTPKNRK